MREGDKGGRRWEIKGESEADTIAMVWRYSGELVGTDEADEMEWLKGQRDREMFQ